MIIEKSALVDGKLTLIFDRKTYELKQWIVTDAQGLNTSVAIYNITTGKPQDPAFSTSTPDHTRNGGRGPWRPAPPAGS